MKRKAGIVCIIVLVIIISFVYINSKNKDTLNTIQENQNNEEYSNIEKVFLDRNGEKLESLPILMYHCFYDESAGEQGENSNWMEISDFEEQMRYLSENNYYYPSWDEVYEFVNGTKDLPSKSIVITMDDGHESVYSLALPILNKYNVSATAFVITDWTGKNVIQKYKSDILNFQSHSHDMHKAGKDGKGAFLTITKEEAEKDLETTKKILESSDAFCYPFGDTNEFTHKMLSEAGFKVAVTTKSGRVTPGADPLLLTRVRMSKGDSLSEFIDRIK